MTHKISAGSVSKMNSTEKVKKCKTGCFIGCSEAETQREKNSMYMTKGKLIRSFKLKLFIHTEPVHINS